MGKSGGRTSPSCLPERTTGRKCWGCLSVRAARTAVKEKDSREIISILHRNLPLWETVRLDYPVAVLRVLVKSDAGQWEDEEYVKIEKIIGAVRELISYAELMRKERQE